jgi:uncharacterized protein YqeY
VSLKDRLQEELAAAMRSRDALRRDTLRMVTSALYNAEKAKLAPLGDDEVDGVLAREIKQRRESVEAFRGGGREDLATKEEAELRILAEFMPQLGEDELHALIRQAIDGTQATSMRDMRAVMDWLRPRTSGRTDSKRVGELVARALASSDLDAHVPAHASTGDSKASGARGGSAAG